MKTTRHWLHILLVVLTSGLWLPVYLILLATREEYNRGHRAGKAAGRREIAADPEWMRVSEYHKSGVHTVEPGSGSVHVTVRGGVTKRYRDACGNLIVNHHGCGTYVDDQGRRVIHDGNGDVRFGCTAAPVVPFDEAKPATSRVDRFAELADRNRTVGLDMHERAEYTQLRQELSQ
jgi:hypothetical protein